MGARDDDMLDVINEQGEVIDTLPFREVHDKDLLHRFCRVLVINDKDEVILHKRTSLVSDAGRLDSAGGHLDPGETYEQAIVRELAEEMDIHVSIEDLSFIGKIRDYRPSHENMIAQVYVLSNYSGAYIGEESEIASFVKVPLVDFLDVEKFKTYGEPSPKITACAEAYKEYLKNNEP